MGPVLSIVAPAYNEERNIHAFLGAIIPVLEGIGETFEIIFVDDGSRDNTLGMLAAAASQDARVKVISLARNFGKDIALSAGLSHATGRAVIPIDCDLQHPPELIPAFVAKWREGYDMVIGVRSRRDEEGFVRRTLSRTYYKAMRYMTSVEIPPNAGDFRLLDRKILDVINKMPERHRFMKGIFAWPGFRVASIEFQANVRANETRSTWSFFKLWRFALDGLFSFSTAPLKLWTYIGALSAGGAFLYLLITIIQKLFWGIAVPGYASLLIVLLFFNGLLLISNGIQGEYIARIFEEVKGRPLYVVGQTFGFGEDAAVVARPLPPFATAPHVAPPPPDHNATQIGIPTAPTEANAPLAVAASPPRRAKPPTVPGALTATALADVAAPAQPAASEVPKGRPASARTSPAATITRAHTPSQQPFSATAFVQSRTQPRTSPEPSSPPIAGAPHPVAAASMRAPSSPPYTPPTRAPSSPPYTPPTRAPSSPPVVASPTRPPSSPPIAAPARPPSSPPIAAASDEPAPGDTTVPTPTTPAEPARPRRELPKPKGPTLPR